MTKYWLLVFALSFNNFFYADNAGKIWATTGALCAGGTIAYAALFRQSNDAVIAHVHDVHFAFKKNENCKKLQMIQSCEQMQQYLSSLSRLEQKEMNEQLEMVKNLFKVMDNRYNSWFKPWNWSKKMKKAFAVISDIHQSMRLYEMMMKYAPFIQLYNKVVDQQAIVRNAQLLAHGQSAYPMLACGRSIRSDLYFLKKQIFIDLDLGFVLIEFLELLHSAIIMDSSYIQEKQHEELALLKKQEVQAAQSQAQAQEQQAKAQREQAAALRESNDLKRQKLENDRSRTNQDEKSYRS